jgi:lipoprotein-anchoring transpeptidase ErfK/SrfK
MGKLQQVFRDNVTIAWIPIAITLLLLLGSGALVLSAADVRYRRDVHRIGFNDNWGLLDQVKREAGLLNDSLEHVTSESGVPTNRAYIVVSIEDRRLWYKIGDSTIFTTQVAVGSGKTLVQGEGHEEWKFDTPRGRLVVESKEENPMWVPPDWHFVELARKNGLGVVKLNRGQAIPAPDGSVITVDGNDVVRQFQDGRVVPFPPADDTTRKGRREIILGGNIIIPPYGTNQRRYAGILGTHRLNLGDGYGIHGTDEPESIGQAVSHGCVRLRNEDIDYLYDLVPIGTPVYIY